MRLTFRSKLLASHVVLVIAVVLIAIFELNRALGTDLRRQLERRLEDQAVGAAQWAMAGRHPERLAGRLAVVVGARVTILDRRGAVLGDSQTPPEAAAQGIGPEIADAQAGRVGRATRVDPAAGETYYVAVPAGQGLVLRLAAPLSDIDATLRAMRARLLFASALALTAALALALIASRVAARPLRAMAASADRLARGDYDVRVASTSPDEFGRLAHALASLGAQLKDRIGDLTAERDRLTAILAGMVEGVLVTGDRGEILVANPAAEALLRAPALVGRRAEDAAPLPSLHALIARARETGETQQAEIEPSESGGRHLATYVRPLAPPSAKRDPDSQREDSQGDGEAGRKKKNLPASPSPCESLSENLSKNTLGGVVAVLRDMTEVRRFEAMRRDFIANVSHELRTPVTAIQGYAETLLGIASRGEAEAGSGAADPDTTRRFLEIIHRQACRLGRLVEDLLRLSTLEARREGPLPEPVPLGVLAEHVAQTVRARSEAEGVTVAVAIDPAAIALANPGDLEEVLENLVDNAIKYGRPGGTVRVEGDRAGGRVRLAVADDGPGMDARHLPRIFERFYRVDPARSRERGGTGLGLSIVKHLVEGMGGTVGVVSAPGEGCRFTVELPAADAPA